MHTLFVLFLSSFINNRYSPEQTNQIICLKFVYHNSNTVTTKQGGRKDGMIQSIIFHTRCIQNSKTSGISSSVLCQNKLQF